ncbi:MAG: hypothetical protein JXB48_20740, partial [Candidatus Latescibacteria bacterium]|nr:hypothetical protein [Candidatus Latescibacterota bacterium]
IVMKNFVCFVFVVLFLYLTNEVCAQSSLALNYYQSFDTFDFLDEDFVARSGMKTKEDRGMTLEPGKFGKGLRMNLTPKIVPLHEMSGVILDEITGAMFRTGARRKQWTTDNEPFLWGAGKTNTGSGSAAFWVKGPLSESDLFNQSAMVWGRWERFLLTINVDKDQKIGATMVDSRYAHHTIRSNHKWNADNWNHVVLNWDKAKGLELFVNGQSVASSWERDAWWQTALPGLLHFPMPHVIYDELFICSRPLTMQEIKTLMDTNTPPVSEGITRRTTGDRDRLAQAFGIFSGAKLPMITPMAKNSVLSFKEITPEFVGNYKMPAFFCRDGRYELAWPHPLAVFTPIPGDASAQAEKLDIEAPAHIPFNYITLEGNLTGLPSSLFNAKKNKDELFEGTTFFRIPEDERFFFGTMVERKSYPRFTLPFVKGYGAPPDFSGNLHLPLTGDTRIHEVGLFDVTETENIAVPGEMVYYLRRGGSLEYRYDFALRTFYALDERETYYGYRTVPEGDSEWIDTGYMQRINLLTSPMSGRECIGSIVLNLEIKTETPEDYLLVRLRDPGLQHRIWTHAEVKLSGFDGDGATLRLMLDPPPIIMPEGDVIWLDIATYNNAKIKIGGKDTSKIVLKTAPFFESEKPFELKGLMPVIAECTKAHYQPWLFENIWPDIYKPHTFGGHFDSIMPALAVQRVLPHSRIARQYIDLAKLPEGHVSELRNSSLAVKEEKTFNESEIPQGVPKWAYLQCAIRNFRFNVIDWMVRNQNPDGQLSEGWNDDVFMITGKNEIPLDSCDRARDMYLRFFEGLDKTNILGDGYIQISPLDSLHAWDFHCERFHSVLYKLGDPYIIRRSLKSAWHLGKPDQTPQYYNNGEPFMYSHNILEWYWGRNPRRSYTSPEADKVEKSLVELYLNCDDIHFFRCTEAWNTMRSIGNEHLITGMIIGGWSHSTRNPRVEDRSISVSWPEGGGEDLARWVTSADSTQLTCRMFSFDPLPRSVKARLFRIDPGTYEITLSQDRNGSSGTEIFSEQRELLRYDTITFEVPPGKPVLLTVKQIKKARDQGPFADLAVADYDCERVGSTLRVRVSNVGAAESKNTSVIVYDESGRKISEKKVTALKAPIDFVEKSTVVEFSDVPRTGELRVVVDEKNGIKELYEGNNCVMVR